MLELLSQLPVMILDNLIGCIISGVFTSIFLWVKSTYGKKKPKIRKVRKVKKSENGKESSSRHKNQTPTPPAA